MSQKKKNPNLIVLGIFLGVIGAVAAGLLACVDRLTVEPIEKAKLAKTNQALKDVLPEYDNVPANDTVEVDAKNGTKVIFYLAKQGEKVVGVAGQGYSDKGFAGKVVVMVGMDPTGKIKTVLVTEQKETPGLGTVVTDRVRQKSIWDIFSNKKEETGLPSNKILDGFDGETAVPDSPWKVKKDGGKFAFVTGATITSRAVTNAVYTVDSTFVEKKVKIIGPVAGNAQ